MIRRPPRSTLDRSSAASDVYKRQDKGDTEKKCTEVFADYIFIKNFQNRFFAAANVNYKTVSYTHLRAHETVLDLVCRLLLEKKTKK